MPVRISIDEQVIAAFCRRYHIRKLSLFGSVLRDDFGPESDVDVLVEFDPDHIPGLAFFAMEDELSDIMSYPADLNTLNFFKLLYPRQGAGRGRAPICPTLTSDLPPLGAELERLLSPENNVV